MFFFLKSISFVNEADRLYKQNRYYILSGVSGGWFFVGCLTMGK
jgi:hypothetical protein